MIIYNLCCKEFNRLYETQAFVNETIGDILIFIMIC